MAKKKNVELNELVLGYAGAIISAACMLLLSLVSSAGYYKGASSAMAQWHMFYNPNTAAGVLGGMVEAAVVTFVLLYAFGWVYNRLL